MRSAIFALAAIGLSGGAFAQEGDPAAGEQVFNQCSQCHVVTDDEGNTLAGRSGRVGPNLYGVVGRTAGTVEDFRYSSSMVEAGEAGLEWNVEDFVVYVQDPTGFLREYLDDRGARGKMTFRLRDEEDARNVFAYLRSLGPDGGEADSGS